MEIRLYDKFDSNFTVATYKDVECVYDNTITFNDGDEIEFDGEFVDYEVLAEDRQEGWNMPSLFFSHILHTF